MSEFLISGGPLDAAQLHDHMTREPEPWPSTSLRSDLWVSLRDPTLFGLRWLGRLKRLARWTVYQITNAYPRGGRWSPARRPAQRSLD